MRTPGKAIHRPHPLLEALASLRTLYLPEGCLASRRGLRCPACGSVHVAQVLGDNGGVTYVCTACSYSWS